ncbi:hypothetical protein HMPREF1548_02668 [Clostridium sp. KLE 1755]|nr:hypothetical protein HMPREF1548_02668 [Clostridium sp. KLE 1755]
MRSFALKYSFWQKKKKQRGKLILAVLLHSLLNYLTQASYRLENHPACTKPV